MAELANLPALTARELTELEAALDARLDWLGPAWPESRQITSSLLTAVREARYSLDRGDDG